MDKKLGRMCEFACATAHELYATMNVNGSSAAAENITEIHWNDKYNGDTAKTNSKQNLQQLVDFHETTTFMPNIEAPSVTGLKLEESSERKNLSQQSSLDGFPYEWFREYMETMKKDMVKEISMEVIRNVTEILNKQVILKPSCPQEFKHVRNEPDQILTKQYDLSTSNIQSMQENLYKMGNEQLEHKNVKPRGLNKNTYSTDEIKRKWEKEDDYVFQRLPGDMHTVCVNDLDKGIRKREDCIPSGDKTIKQDLYPTAKLSSLQSETLEAACSKCDILDVSAQGENHLRMNCSVTGHQILNKSYVKDQMVCSGSDIDNISICSIASNNSGGQSENNFEVIHLLPNFESKRSDFSNLNHILYNEKPENNCSTGASDIARYNHITCKDENNGSSRDSPSFELLSESASPSLSVYIDDERPGHNENTIEPSTRTMEYMFTEQDNVATAPLPKASDTSVQPESVKNLYSKSDSLEAAKPGGKELRMNCSITGHQLLSKANVKNVMVCSASAKNSINLCFSTVNNVEPHCDHNFELVQIPQCSEADACNKSNESLHDRKEKNESSMNSSNNTRFNVVIYHVGSNRSSPSASGGNFESLPDTVSPAVSIYINDDKFSCSESDIHAAKNVNVTKCNDDDDKNDSNGQKYCPRQTNVNEKLCANCDMDNCVNVGFEKRSGGAYSFVADTLPGHAKEEGTYSPLKSEHARQPRPGRSNDINVDVKSSHTSYPAKVESNKNVWSNIPLNNCNHSQQQPDSNEFAQSFHSHTTSRTDSDGRTAEQVTTSSRESSMNKHRTNKKFRQKWEGNTNGRKYSSDSTVTAEPVQILPETLVTGMPHVASLACDTARRVCDRILRRYVKEVSYQRTGLDLNDRRRK